jgi:hypothetical protein
MTPKRGRKTNVLQKVFPNKQERGINLLPSAVKSQKTERLTNHGNDWKITYEHQ